MPAPPQNPLALRLDWLRAGLDRLDQGFSLFDANLRLVGWNRAFIQLLGFPEALAYEGAPFESFIRHNAERGEYGPGDVERLIADRVAAALGFRPHQTERVRPNGQVIHVRGEPVPGLGFVTLYTDVTEQRRAEQLIREHSTQLEERVRERTVELEAANQRLRAVNGMNVEIGEQLRQSEARLRLITDTIPAMIAYIDAHATYRYANRRYAEWTGRPVAAIIGRHASEVLGASVYPRIAGDVERALSGEAISYEYERLRDDGSVQVARSTLVPERDADGRVVGLFVMSVDATEQRRAAVELARAQRMEAFGRMAGGLAHDFNNLLTVLIGNLAGLQERVQRDGATAADVAERVAPALAAARRGAELVRRLSSFARQQPLEPRPVDVAAQVAELGVLLRRTLPATIALDIVVDASGGAPWALVDPDQLDAALLNLAFNARDAMPLGGRLDIDATRVVLDATAARPLEATAGAYVRIRVRDTGTGMDEATLSRAFEPYFTTKQAGGSGLGLAMVYGFARQSRGAVRASSKPAQGTEFSLWLPWSEPQPEDAGTVVASPGAAGDRNESGDPLAGLDTRAGSPADAVPSSRSAAPADAPATDRDATEGGDASRPLVLLVDDDRPVREAVRGLLGDLGHPVIEAADGREACVLIDAVAEIGLVVSDVVMPGPLDGHAVAAYARDRVRPLPVLLVSGHGGVDENAEAGSRPLLLAKPFGREELASAIARALGEART